MIDLYPTPQKKSTLHSARVYINDETKKKIRARPTVIPALKKSKVTQSLKDGWFSDRARVRTKKNNV